MKKKLLFIILLLQGAVVIAQECPDLLVPFNGETNVSVSTNISWEAEEGVPGYQIRLGTSIGSADIYQASVGVATNYTPPLGLPANTRIYVTIVLDFLFEAGEDIVCESQSFTTENITTVPNCTQFNFTDDGSDNISVFTSISWNYATTATGYLLSLGTMPGTYDILNNLDVGNNLRYTPTEELQENTVYYVRVLSYNANGTSQTCSEISFTTGLLATLPGCTNLISPFNGETNVPLTPLLVWEEIPGAIGYQITIGDTPGGNNILDGASFFTNSTLVLNFEPNKTFFITIIPFNESGIAIDCGQESFSTILGCGPYFNPVINQFIDFKPEINLMETFSFCQNEEPLTIEAPPNADGYRWFQLDRFDNETLLSENRELTINENGNYYLEAYNLITQGNSIIECPVVIPFKVVSSEIPNIDGINVEETLQGQTITVLASGEGDFEYAMDNASGPYQDSNVFSQIPPGNHTFYVRDKNGCGIAQETLEQDITLEGFPKFFTPNGDNINDLWQFEPPVDAEPILFEQILIFNRYGHLCKEISSGPQVWDGTFMGKPAPEGEYWFRATASDQKVYVGHFSIKR